MADATADMLGAQTTLALSRPGAMAALSQAQAPVISVSGAEDRQVPPALGRAAADAAPKGTFRMIEGAGHYALLEAPQACADAVAGIEAPLR